MNLGSSGACGYNLNVFKKMSKMKFFLDSDGVAASFDEHVLNLFGGYPNDLGDAVMWKLANAHPNFWDGMPVIEGAHEFWAEVKVLSPTILTGCPKSDYDRAADHKRIWWKKHFDHEDVITCLSRDKALHMQNPGDILVDDTKRNIKRWEAAGGVGILHRSFGETLAELRKLGVLGR